MDYVSFVFSTGALSVGLLVACFFMSEDNYKGASFVLFAFNLLTLMNLVLVNPY